MGLTHKPPSFMTVINRLESERNGSASKAVTRKAPDGTAADMKLFRVVGAFPFVET